jgi:hypothetical protein
MLPYEEPYFLSGNQAIRWRDIEQGTPTQPVSASVPYWNVDTLNQIKESKLLTAVSAQHTQNTDQYLDYGGVNQVSAASLHSMVGGGPYLPISAGVSYALTGDLYISKTTPSFYLADATNAQFYMYQSHQSSPSAEYTYFKATYTSGTQTIFRILHPNLANTTNVTLGSTDINTLTLTTATNSIALSDMATAVSLEHTQGTDTTLGTMTANVNWGGYSITKLKIDCGTSHR